MRTADFDYDLPPERIAQTPAEPRDSARLMVVHRDTGFIEHRRFGDLVDYVRPGDRLVANDSRVMPGRLLGRKATSGGRVEVLLLRPIGDPAQPADDRLWECLIGGRVREGTTLVFEAPGAVDIDGAPPTTADPAPPPRLAADVVAVLADGRRNVRFDAPPLAVLDRLGRMPLPPYIHQQPADPERYQTVYADAVGSAAAPTAGLHFTPRLIATLAARGVDWSTVTLHIGLDTFKPVEAEAVHDHRIHREWAELDAATAEAIGATRHRGGRVIAVGTTSVRVLETAARVSAVSASVPATATSASSALSVPDTSSMPSTPSTAATTPIAPFSGWTDLFITPGFDFRATDALITNFHLPRSSLLMLVAAFAGKALIDRAYAEAIRLGYRFYSFGDAMLIVSSSADARRAT